MDPLLLGQAMLVVVATSGLLQPHLLVLKMVVALWDIFELCARVQGDCKTDVRKNQHAQEKERREEGGRSCHNPGCSASPAIKKKKEKEKISNKLLGTVKASNIQT